MTSSLMPVGRLSGFRLNGPGSSSSTSYAGFRVRHRPQ
jgi:hypothetical protein